MPVKTYSDMLTYLSLITLYAVIHKLILCIFGTSPSLIFFTNIPS